MKLEAKFKAENNKLFDLEGKEFSLSNVTFLEAKDCVGESCKIEDTSKIYGIKTPWTLVGLNEDSYNEEFLAGFRDWLKALEEKNGFAFIVPVADQSVSSDEERENFTQSMKHCSRRIKDCASVVGFAVPEECDKEHFAEEITAKHKHYILFINKECNNLQNTALFS